MTRHDAEEVAARKALTIATGPLDETGFEIEEALRSEGIYVWGPDGERFERMFDVVMRIRRTAINPALFRTDRGE